MNDPMNLTSVTLARAPVFRLGALEVRPPTREVVGTNCRDVLEPRVMQVLVVLAQANGDVVTRDDLMLRCWEGRVVGDDALNRVIGKIRRLAERPGSGFALETIRKVGYRLTTTTEVPEGRDAGPLGDGGPTRTPKRRLRWPWLATGLIAIAFMAWVALATALPPGTTGRLLAVALPPPLSKVWVVDAWPNGASGMPHATASTLSGELDLAVENRSPARPLTGAARPAAAESSSDIGASNRPMSLLPPA